MKNFTDTPILSVSNLTIMFHTEKGLVTAVSNISFDIYPGETIGLVGESGCGKSITALSILGLIPKTSGVIGVGSSIKFLGQELIGLSESQYQKIRGSKISMIFQEPMTALNPVFTIGHQMEDVLIRHENLNRKEARRFAINMLGEVGIADPESRIKNYPHQLSGGMRQRVMIAMALSCNPSLLLADEPTTALDVTIQAQIMEQMARLQQVKKMATVLITHDLAIIAEFCKRVMVMYCGKMVEQAPVLELFQTPRHPYTRGLLDSIPQIRAEKLARLPVIPGTVPDLHSLPSGCRFSDRCSRTVTKCAESHPDLTSVTVDLNKLFAPKVACYNPY